MNIDGAVGRNLKHRFGKDFAVGNDDNEIRLQCPETRLFFFAFQAFRLVEGNLMGQCKGLDRREIHFPAPSVDTVGLAVNGTGRIAVVYKSFQGGNTEIRGTHEDNTVGIIHRFSVLYEEKWLFQ